MIKVLSLVYFLLLHNNGNGQTGPAFINNNSIVFNFRFISPSVLDTYRIPSQYIVRVELTKEKRKMAKQLSKGDWLNLLEDTTTDWAANLILYDIYKRDATLLWAREDKSRSLWAYAFKEDDIKYWTKVLK